MDWLCLWVWLFFQSLNVGVVPETSVCLSKLEDSEKIMHDKVVTDILQDQKAEVTKYKSTLKLSRHSIPPFSTSSCLLWDRAAQCCSSSRGFLYFNCESSSYRQTGVSDSGEITTSVAGFPQPTRRYYLMFTPHLPQRLRRGRIYILLIVNKSSAEI